MNACALLVGVVLAGIAVQAATSLFQAGRLELSRFWYLALGLVLMLPTTDYPLGLLHAMRNPNPRHQAFNLPLTLAWGVGLYCVIRFVMTSPAKPRAVTEA